MAEKSKVTRIKATDDTPKEAKVSRKEKRAAKKMQIEKPYSKHWYVRFFQRIGRYFKGSWIELKQVRWPTRKATWSLTIAVVIFSGFFVGLIMLLDLGFNALFELIISK